MQGWTCKDMHPATLACKRGSGTEARLSDRGVHDDDAAAAASRGWLWARRWQSQPAGEGRGGGAGLTQALQLLTEAVDVALRGDGGMRAGLNCILHTKERVSSQELPVACSEPVAFHAADRQVHW